MARRTFDVLSEKLVQGADPDDARQDTIREMSEELASELRHQPLEGALASIGINGSLARAIREEAQSESRRHFVDAFQIIVGGGGAGSVPTAECLKRYLPIGRKPTKDEVDAAIKACRKSSAVAQAF